MDKIIPIRLDEGLVASIDSLVEKGIFRNRNEGLRQGIRELIQKYQNDKSNRKEISKIVSNYLYSQYPDLIKTIVLFGSVARNTDTEYSDIDLFIITSKKISYNERLEIIDHVNTLIFQCNYLISLHFAETTKFLKYLSLNYEFETNIATQGIILNGEKVWDV